jgi:DNA-binding Lrp family transcriptional regulator
VAHAPSAAVTIGYRREEALLVQAYVLIQTDTGRAASVANSIREMAGVLSTEAVTGPYDVVVFAEAEDVDALGQLVVTRIQPVDGIVRTLTCPVVKL